MSLYEQKDGHDSRPNDDERMRKTRLRMVSANKLWMIPIHMIYGYLDVPVPGSYDQWLGYKWVNFTLIY